MVALLNGPRAVLKIRLHIYKPEGVTQTRKETLASAILPTIHEEVMIYITFFCSFFPY
jgi:hypothetical protein